MIEEPLAIYYPWCSKKYALHECPLNKIEIYSLCNGNHVTNDYECMIVSQISVANMVIEENYIV